MMRHLRVVASLLAVCLLAVGPAFGDVTNGQKIKSKGVITNRTGDTLLVKTADGPYTVVLTSDTKVQRPAGLIGLRKTPMSPDVLIPGLRISFEGVGDDQNRVVAKEINFEMDDLSLAEVIQAGLNPTAQQQAANMRNIEANREAGEANKREIDANRQRIAANEQNLEEVAQATKKRFSELGEWVVKGEAIVHFAVGDSTLSEEAKQKIAIQAQTALTLKGYVIEVKGFADATGNLADNQQLSKERAQAVVAYLLQECRVPVKNVVTPGAMGETRPVASNESASGRAENRRVELRILVSKGVAGIGGGN